MVGVEAAESAAQLVTRAGDSSGHHQLEAERAAIVKLYEAGKSPRQLSLKFGVNDKMIHRPICVSC